MSSGFLKNKFTRKLAAKFFVLKKAIPRSFLAMRYLRGEGIEIGALHNPVYLGAFAKAKYVDRMSAKDLLIEFPELGDFSIVDPDIIDNGEQLYSVPLNSQDFIIANHFIEHCEDPITTLKGFLERLKENGVLYLAVPDKRFTFDKGRPSTGFAHLVDDYEEGPHTSREGHYIEWASHMSRDRDPVIAAQEMLEKRSNIHFHVWTRGEFKEFLEQMNVRYRLPFMLVTSCSAGDEAIFIIRKLSQ